MNNNTYYFSDFITNKAITNCSVLCAGLDPVIESFPNFFKEQSQKATNSNEDFFESVIFNFYQFCLTRISTQICSIKPNIAFFEQYGIGGLKALQKILKLSAELNIPSILDCKRGDIGSTALAYVNAYLPKGAPFEADAITVNAFLGFDTAKTFLDGAIQANGKGLFFLVKTSNPGSADLQDLKSNDLTISEHIAKWINDNSAKLSKDNSISGLGAVVGATHPEHLKSLRSQMPNSIFLIPGYGAQGGKASDLTFAFTAPYKGAVINASRGIFSTFSSSDLSPEQIEQELTSKISQMNLDLKTTF
jgi:orotidine-5'-phosphate decarboxylase